MEGNHNLFSPGSGFAYYCTGRALGWAGALLICVRPRLQPPILHRARQIGKTWGAGRRCREQQSDVAVFISFRQFIAGEEEAQLEAGRIFGVGAVNSIFFDAGRPLLAD